MNTNVIDKLEKMFRNCHALIVHNRPITDYLWLCDLNDMKGLDLGITYRNKESAKVFINVIAEVELKRVSSLIQQAKFICVIGDGSTDSAVQEQDMWFLRFSICGKVMVKFVGVASVERANAENIVNGLKHIVKSNMKLEWDLFVKKLVAISCDGASVMVGCRSGVATLLRNDQPRILTLHCMAHRLELCLKDSAKKLQLYDKTFSVLVMGLYYFYHNSSLNRSMLKVSFNALKQSKDDKLLMPVKASGTRWIGHLFRATTNIVSSYKYIVAYLSQLTETTERVSSDSKSKAKAFLNLLKSKDIVCFLHFMLDLLSPLRRLSLQLQDQTCVIGKQFQLLSTTVDVINKFKSSDGQRLGGVIGLDVFEDVTLTHCNMQQFKSARIKIVDSIEKALLARFSEFSSATVVRATRIADIQSWPRDWNQLKDYGDGDISLLLEHYKGLLTSADVCLDEILTEWTMIKREIFDSDHLGKDASISDWNELLRRFQRQYPNVAALIDLVLAMSPSSAEVERGFSQLKLVKTNIRSKLGQISLNNCLAIKMLSDGVKTFNPLPAIRHWNCSSVKGRKPNFKNTQSKKTSASFKLNVDMGIQVENECIGSDAEHEKTEMTNSDVETEDHVIGIIDNEKTDETEVVASSNNVEKDFDEV